MGLILQTEFKRGGGVENKWSSESILGDPYGLKSRGFTFQWVLVLDFLWILMVTLLMVGEFKEMKELRVKYLHDFWNVLDWIQCLLTIAIECYWIFIVVQGYSLVDMHANSH